MSALIRTVSYMVIITGNREAIQNIIKNAIEHSNTGENVNVKTEDNDVYTAVYITNTGEKLTDMQQKQIFERYYSEAKFEDNSMGIGLPGWQRQLWRSRADISRLIVMRIRQHL